MPRTIPAPINTPPKPWSPCPELQALIAPLIQAQLSVVADRLFGLRHLQRFTIDSAALPEDQVRSCAKIKFLPFLRISKKLRTDPLNAEFIEAGRAFNRELLQARSNPGTRLREIALNPEISPEVRRLAACVHARTAYLRIEYAEVYEGELPAHLLPPKDADAFWDPSDFDTSPSAAAFFNPSPQNHPALAPQTAAQRRSSAAPAAPVITAADPATAAVALLARRASDHHTSLTAAAAFNPFAQPIPQPTDIPTGTEAATKNQDLIFVRVSNLR